MGKAEKHKTNIVIMNFYFFNNTKLHFLILVLSFLIPLIFIGCHSNDSTDYSNNVINDSISPANFNRNKEINITDSNINNGAGLYATGGANLDSNVNYSHGENNVTVIDNTIDAISGNINTSDSSHGGSFTGQKPNDGFGYGIESYENLQIQVWEFLNNQIWNILSVIGAFFFLIIAYYLFYNACKLEDSNKISVLFIDFIIVLLSLFPLIFILIFDRYSWQDILYNIFYQISLKITIGVFIIISTFIIIISLIKYLNIAILSSKNNDLKKRKVSYLGIIISLIHLCGSCASIFFFYEKFK